MLFVGEELFIRECVLSGLLESVFRIIWFERLYDGMALGCVFRISGWLLKYWSSKNSCCVVGGRSCFWSVCEVIEWYVWTREGVFRSKNGLLCG